MGSLKPLWIEKNSLQISITLDVEILFSHLLKNSHYKNFKTKSLVRTHNKRNRDLHT